MLIVSKTENLNILSFLFVYMALICPTLHWPLTVITPWEVIKIFLAAGGAAESFVLNPAKLN